MQIADINLQTYTNTIIEIIIEYNILYRYSIILDDNHQSEQLWYCDTNHTTLS